MKIKLTIFSIILVVCLGGLGAYQFLLPRLSSDRELQSGKSEIVDIKIRTPQTTEKLGFALPDALILSASLTNLPRDILANPVMKAVFSEDFLFYYENNETRLSLDGTLRRIIYENKLDVPFNIMKMALDAPAEIAFWKGNDGRLRHYILVLESGVLSNLMELAVTVSQNDRSLKKYKTLQMNAVEQVDIYELKYGSYKRIYFTSVNGRHYFFSDSSVINAKPLKSIFGRPLENGVFSTAFDLAGNAGKHSIILAAPYLSMGYHRFFPTLTALGFFFNGAEWQTWTFTDKAHAVKNSYLNSAELWKAVPSSPAFCTALPVDPTTVQDILSYIAQSEKSGQKILETITSATAVCWYAEGGLFSPLVISHAENLSVHKDFLKRIFEETVSGKLQPPARDSRDGVIFRKRLTGYGGIVHDVRFGYWKDYLLFSQNGTLVENACVALDRKSPVMVDQLPKNQANIALVLSPNHLSRLLQTSVMETLKRHEEKVFSDAVANRLLPLFERMNKLPVYSLNMPQGREQPASKDTFWERVQWNH